jgi:hypothetical protein
MLGKLGVKGKGFCSTKVENSTFFGCSVSDRLLVGVLRYCFAQRREDEKAVVV